MSTTEPYLPKTQVGPFIIEVQKNTGSGKPFTWVVRTSRTSTNPEPVIVYGANPAFNDPTFDTPDEALKAGELATGRLFLRCANILLGA